MRNLIFISFFLFLVLHAGAQEKPNIILVMADDLGYGDLGCYGSEKIKTPNLDAMAAAGVKFTNFYSGSTVCAPSRCVLITGKHTGHSAIRGNFQTDEDENAPLPKNEKTIAEYLKTAGYYNVIIGKWGLGGIGNGPVAQGFDYSFGYLDQIKAHNYYPPYVIENEKKFMLPENADGKKSMYSHHLFARKTIEFLKLKHDQPFFLYLAYTLPHGDHVIPDDAPYSNEDWPQTMKNYAAMITLLDSDVGRIFRTLTEEGLDHNTLVIFTSDNGANPAFARFFKSNGSWRGAKRDMYEGGIHVPFIAWGPGLIKGGGRVSSHIAAAWDLLPTFCELAGVKPPRDIDGISILPELKGEKQKTHDFLYWEDYPYNYNWKKPGNKIARNYLDSRAVRMGRWKGVQDNLYKNPSARVQLYDLVQDPAEAHDVAADHPDIVARIEKIMSKASIPDPPYFPYAQSND